MPKVHARVLRAKSKERECFPWLTCPVAECKQRIAPRDLVRLIDDTGGAEVSLPIRFIVALGHKMVVKYPEWVPCKKKSCASGFFVDGKGGWIKRCKVCRRSQRPKRKKSAPDSVIQRLIADQAIRPCPSAAGKA